MVALGLSDREIARRLVLSPKTVEKHVGSAIRKTGLGQPYRRRRPRTRAGLDLTVRGRRGRRRAT